MSRRDEILECKVFVGGLPHDATTQELEEAFGRYGPIRKVWMARRPPGFAFIEFEDSRDADDAVKALNGAYVFFLIAFLSLAYPRFLDFKAKGGWLVKMRKMKYPPAKNYRGGGYWIR
uniref:RRM domain-containing protein n=2 Tax=Ascaris lumbricoides TaxID=6252 RepID=A0A0M3IXV3_ASCLU